MIYRYLIFFQHKLVHIYSKIGSVIKRVIKLITAHQIEIDSFFLLCITKSVNIIIIFLFQVAN